MTDINPGLAIEGFVISAKNRTFDSNIDRHHPEVTWANADSARSQDNFPEIKKGVERSLTSLQYTLYKESTHGDLLNELGGFLGLVENAKTPDELSDAIVAWRPVLDKAFKMR